MTVFTNLSVLALAFAGLCTALEKRELKSLNSHYDYIVVGGGVSGLVVANRLTENANSAFLHQNHERFERLSIRSADMTCRNRPRRRIRRTSPHAQCFCPRLRAE
jgi:hypothetical protein